MQEQTHSIDDLLLALTTKADLADVRGEMIKWMVGICLAGNAAIVCVMMIYGTVLLSAVETAPPAQLPPIIINVPAPAPVAEIKGQRAATGALLMSPPPAPPAK